MARLTAMMRVAAMRRLAEQSGGFGTVIHRGDEISGDIIVMLLERGGNPQLFRRLLDVDGEYRWAPIAFKTAEKHEIEDYVATAKKRDPDLWLVELDIAHKAPFIEQMSEIN